MENLVEFLKDKKTYWRLELINHHEDVNLGASARIKDPLFAVGRQWQLNRFRAFNGGSLVSAIVFNAKRRLRARGEDESPLEFQLNETKEASEIPELQVPEDWNQESLQYKGGIGDKEENALFTFQGLKGENFDWYNFRINKDPFAEISVNEEDIAPRKFSYKGQPERRWWTFEDSRVSLNSIMRPYVNPATILLMGTLQSSASYSTYTVPFPIKPGEVVQIAALNLFDSFGNKRSYENANQIFSHSAKEGTDAKNVFYFPDSMINRAQNSEILEEVQFNTDHFSNVVWAIEKRLLDDQGFPENIDERADDNEESSQLIKDIRTTALYIREDGERINYFIDGWKPKDNSDALYLEQLQVLSRVPKNAFPLIKQDGKLMLGKVRKDSSYQTNILKTMQFIDSSYLPEHPSRLVRRYYLAFDSDKKPYLWVGTQHRLSERAFPIPVLFDQLV